jgi:hypothetical protein
MAFVVAAFVVAALVLDEPAAASKPCRPKSSRLAATQGHARAYWRNGQLVYCRTPTAKRNFVVLASYGAFPPPAVDLAGKLIGYAASYPEDIGLAFSNFISVDDLTARAGRDIPVYETNLENLLVPNAPGSIRITSAGGVAWIGCEEGEFSEHHLLDCPRRSDRVVYKHDSTDPSTAPPELLARAKGIRLRSLHLHTSRLSWRKRGTLKTATLR